MGVEIVQQARSFGRKVGETFFNIQVDLNKPGYDSKKTWRDWKDIRSRLNGVSPQDIETTGERIEKAFREYYYGADGGDVGFSIQPRGSYKDPDTLYGDISNYLPALANVDAQTRHDLFYQLPPFQVAKYEYSFGGKQGMGSVICVPLSVDRMIEANSAGTSVTDSRRRVALYAQPIILDAARFAKDKLGIKSIGLGETMAAMTRYGIDIERRLAGVEVTTGHAGTTWLIDQTIMAAAEKAGLDLSEELVGIIGCGSIGRAAAFNLDGRVGGYVVNDINPTTAERLKKDLIDAYPNMPVVMADDAAMVCQRSRLIVGAASNLTPILTRDIIRPNTIIIDDSQPVTARREEVEAAGSIVVWPIAKMPSVLDRIDYNFGPQGVLPGTGWGCEMEVITLTATDNMKDGRVNHRVTNDDVSTVGRLAQQLGFGVSEPLQSFGRSITNDQWKGIREARSK